MLIVLDKMNGKAVEIKTGSHFLLRVLHVVRSSRK